MDEATIREQVFSRKIELDATVSWFTPAGNPRSAPIYEVEVRNDYLNKSRTLKAKSESELQTKVDACLNTWAEQEVRKRLVEAKQDAKEQAQAEAARLDTEAKEVIVQAQGLLAATLSIDDRIDWDAERDTRRFKEFSFPPPPPQPVPTEPTLPQKPALSWLLHWRLHRWVSECERLAAEHSDAEQAAQDRYDTPIGTVGESTRTR